MIIMDIQPSLGKEDRWKPPYYEIDNRSPNPRLHAMIAYSKAHAYSTGSNQV